MELDTAPYPSQGQFLSTLNLSDFGFGEETVGYEGSGAHIDAAVGRKAFLHWRRRSVRSNCP